MRALRRRQARIASSVRSMVIPLLLIIPKLQLCVKIFPQWKGLHIRTYIIAGKRCKTGGMVEGFKKSLLYFCCETALFMIK